MDAQQPTTQTTTRESRRAAGIRLIHVIVAETLLVGLGGMVVWGIAWDLGYPTVGLVLAIIIWLTVSPAIEIATVVNFRNNEKRTES